MQAASRKRLILFLNLLVSVIGISAIYYVAQKPTLPATIEWHDDQAIIVASPYHGLPPGARLTKLNGIALSDILHLEHILDHQRIGSVIAAELQIDGHLTPRMIPLVPHYGLAYMIILVFSSLVFILFGLFVYLKRQDDQAAELLHWLTLSIAAVVLFDWGRAGTYSIVHRAMFGIAYAIVPAVFIHFSSRYPSFLTGFRGQLYRPAYLIAAVLGVWSSISLVLVEYVDGMSFSIYQTSAEALDITFAIGTVLAVSNIIHSYRFALEEANRRRIRWMMLGTAAGVLSYVVFWLVPRILDQTPLLSEEAILLCVTISPVTFAISILRYQLFDIDQIVNRASVYVIVFGALLLIYASIIAALANVLGPITSFIPVAPSTMAAIVVALCFEPIRRHTQTVIDKQFFRVKYNYRTLTAEIAGELDRSYSQEQLTTTLSQQLTRVFQPAELRIVLGKDSSEHVLPTAVIEAMQTSSRVYGRPRAIEPGAAVVWIRGEVGEDATQLWVILRSAKGDTLGTVSLGAKRSGLRYSLEDVDLLNAVTQQAALLLERIQLTEGLLRERQEAERLKELNELKTLFVSSVTHDLKTPLTSIKLFAEMLETSYGPDHKQAQEYLGIIEGETDRLRSLIDNVLDYSRIERGIMTYRPELHDLNEVIGSVMSKMHYLLQMQQFELELDQEPGELLVSIDNAAVQSVLINLVSNAIKYSGDRRYLGIRAYSHSGYAVIEVRDKGVGIPGSDLQKIFQPFYRCVGTGGSQASGAGLGLANVKHIMDAHAASISVTSTVGEGTTFTLQFNLVSAHAQTTDY